VPAALPLIVVLWNLAQIPVLVDLVRENENARLGRVAKAGRRRSREFAEGRAGRRRMRSQVEGLVGEMDRDGVEARHLGFLIGDDIADGAVVEPERLSARGKSTGSMADTTDATKIDL
jgi:hypothetical protein